MVTNIRLICNAFAKILGFQDSGYSTSCHVNTPLAKYKVAISNTATYVYRYILPSHVHWSCSLKWSTELLPPYHFSSIKSHFSLPRSGDAYIRQWTKPSLLQAMVCHLLRYANDDLSLIRPLRTNLTEIKVYLTMSFATWGSGHFVQVSKYLLKCRPALL